MYLTDRDIVKYTTVDDKELQDVFDEALKYDESLLISMFDVHYRGKWWQRKTFTVHYQIYHQQYLPNGQFAMEARQMQCASGDKKLAMAYLYGIINGVNKDKFNKY